MALNIPMKIGPQDTSYKNPTLSWKYSVTLYIDIKLKSRKQKNDSFKTKGPNLHRVLIRANSKEEEEHEEAKEEELGHSHC